MGSRGGTVVAVVLAVLVAAVAGLGVGAIFADRGTSGLTSGGGATSTAQPTTAPDGTLTLQTSTTSPAANERVTLSGVLTDGDAGVRIVVQRQTDNEWADFPASTTTKARGAYSLEIALGRKGDNVVRVTAPDSGAASDPVTLVIG